VGEKVVLLEMPAIIYFIDSSTINSLLAQQSQFQRLHSFSMIPPRSNEYKRFDFF